MKFKNGTSEIHLVGREREKRKKSGLWYETEWPRRARMKVEFIFRSFFSCSSLSHIAFFSDRARLQKNTVLECCIHTTWSGGREAFRYLYKLSQSTCSERSNFARLLELDIFLRWRRGKKCSFVFVVVSVVRAYQSLVFWCVMRLRCHHAPT